MDTTITLRERGTASTDERAQAGHALAARLGMRPGFIAFLLLETPDDACVAIVIVEDRVSLAAADGLPASWAGPPRQLTGEVIVQKGL